MKLYRSFREEVPEDQYEIELGKANIVREGSDVTVVTYGYMVREAIKAADQLEKDGVSVEIVDLRTVSPLDMETITASVEKTGRLVVVQEAQRQAGVADKVASEVSQRSILSLEEPIKVVAAPDTVFPFGLAENDWIPGADDIVDAVNEIK